MDQFKKWKEKRSFHRVTDLPFWGCFIKELDYVWLWIYRIRESRYNFVKHNFLYHPVAHLSGFWKVKHWAEKERAHFYFWIPFATLVGKCHSKKIRWTAWKTENQMVRHVIFKRLELASRGGCGGWNDCVHSNNGRISNSMESLSPEGKQGATHRWN